MSKKKTIKQTKESIEELKETKKFSFTRSRMEPISLIPVIVLILIAIWYFVSSLR